MLINSGRVGDPIGKAAQDCSRLDLYSYLTARNHFLVHTFAPHCYYLLIFDDFVITEFDSDAPNELRTTVSRKYGHFTLNFSSI